MTVLSCLGLWSVFRQLCLRRWFSCKDSQVSWKQYYLCRSELDFRMQSGRPEKDFVCKALAGHKGKALGVW